MLETLSAFRSSLPTESQPLHLRSATRTKFEEITADLTERCVKPSAKS